MTYDLTLERKSLDEDTFVEFFNDRPHWSLPEDDVAAYDNRDTHTYFHFRFSKGKLQFVLDYCRHVTFALEAINELEAVVDELHLDGFDREKVKREWIDGNVAGYAIAKRDGADLPVYDDDTIGRVWLWNSQLEQTREDNGGHYGGLRVHFVQAEGRVQTLTTLPAGHSVLLPRTDLVRLWKNDESHVVVPWSAIEEVLGLVESNMIDDPFDYWALVELEVGFDRKLAEFFKKGHPSIAFEPLTDVHAREDVDGELGDDDAIG